MCSHGRLTSEKDYVDSNITSIFYNTTGICLHLFNNENGTPSEDEECSYYRYTDA